MVLLARSRLLFSDPGLCKRSSPPLERVMAGGKGGWWGGGRHIRDRGSQTWPSRASRRMHSCVGTRSLTPELPSREVVSGGSVVPGEEEDHLRPPGRCSPLCPPAPETTWRRRAVDCLGVPSLPAAWKRGLSLCPLPLPYTWTKRPWSAQARSRPS